MRIMVCYDDSGAAEAALEEAKKQARAFNGEIMVVTSFVTEDRFHENDISAAKERLKQAQELVEKDAIPCSIHLSIRGLEPGEDLVRFAHENKIEEIVMGIRQRSKVGKLLMGSVLQHVLLSAECPVLGVRKKFV